MAATQLKAMRSGGGTAPSPMARQSRRAPQAAHGAGAFPRAHTASWLGRGAIRDVCARTASVATAAPEGGAAAAAPAVAPAAAPAPGAAPAPEQPFPWTKQWWPVHSVSMLDEARPYPVTLLGQNYVVWWDAPAAKWRLTQDRCPHRLAPLSEGRVEPDGTLMCSYHGWRFDGEGKCTKIPQIGDPKAHAAATASKRSCVATYPTQVKAGLLFAWLESGPEAEAEAAAKPIPMPAAVENSPSPFMMTEVPIDFPMWLEQGFDPSHGPFLHDGIGGMRMQDSEPMDGDRLPLSKVDLLNGFTWTHGAYMQKYHGMKGVRVFEPPMLFHTDYDKGPVAVAAIYAAPSRPGVTRIMAKFTFKGEPPGIFKLLAKLPHWVFLGLKLQDQDTIMNVRQAALMSQQGLTHRDYYSPSRADVGVAAARAWFERAGYDAMWDARMGPAAAAAARAPGPEPSLERMLDVWSRHTRHCKECQKGMAFMERATGAARAAAAVLGVAAVCLFAAARGATPGAALVAAAAVAAYVIAGKLAKARYEKFICSAPAWRRGGGFTGIKGAEGPIQL